MGFNEKALTRGQWSEPIHNEKVSTSEASSKWTLMVHNGSAKSRCIFQVHSELRTWKRHPRKRWNRKTAIMARFLCDISKWTHFAFIQCKLWCGYTDGGIKYVTLSKPYGNDFFLLLLGTTGIKHNSKESSPFQFHSLRLTHTSLSPHPRFLQFLYQERTFLKLFHSGRLLSQNYHQTNPSSVWLKENISQ